MRKRLLSYGLILVMLVSNLNTIVYAAEMPDEGGATVEEQIIPSEEAEAEISGDDASKEAVLSEPVSEEDEAIRTDELVEEEFTEAEEVVMEEATFEEEPQMVRVEFILENAEVSFVNEINDTFFMREIIIPKGNSFGFYANGIEDYVLDEVTFNGIRVNPVDDVYSITPTEDKNVVEVIAIPSPQIVHIENMVADAKLNVKLDDYVKKTGWIDDPSEETNEYSLRYGADSFDFTIEIPKDSLACTVGFADDNLLYHIYDAVEVKEAETSKVYKYSIPSECLCNISPRETIIQVNRVADVNKKVSIAANECIDSFVVYKNDKELLPGEDGKYDVEYGDTLEVTITSKKNYYIGIVKIADGDTNTVLRSPAPFLKEKETITVPVIQNIAMTIDGIVASGTGLIVERTGVYDIVTQKIVPLSSDAYEIVNTKSSSLSTSLEYKLEAGTYRAYYVWNGEKLPVTVVKNNVSYCMSLSVEKEELRIEVSDPNSGIRMKDCNFSFSVDIPNYKARTYKVNLKYSYSLTGITVTNRYMDPMQVTGPVSHFDESTLVTTLSAGTATVNVPDGVGAVVSVIPVRVAGISTSRQSIEGLTYEVSGGGKDCLDVEATTSLSNMRIRLIAKAQTAPTGPAVVTFKLRNQEMVKLTVNVIEPSALTQGSLRVAEVEGTDDTSITLSVREPLGINAITYGKQYYKVEVTPKAGQEAVQTIQPVVQYFEREFPELLDYDGITDDEKIDQKNEEIENAFRQKLKVIVNSATPGSGCAYNYDLKVSMVQVKPGVAMENAAYRSAETMLSASTRNPSYETKLVLKKKAVTIFTGQEDVETSSAQFSANTVCNTVVAKDVTEGLSSEKQLQVTVGKDGQTIFMTAGLLTVLGTHKLAVSPVVPVDKNGKATMHIPPVEYTVTVQEGIHAIQVSAPAVIFKKTDAVATANIGVTLNAGTNAPKLAKVKYMLVDEYGDPLFSNVETDEDGNQVAISTSEKISISAKGVITIAKDFKPDGTNETFRVKVMADDYAGNKATALSGLITITQKAQEIGSLEIFKKDTDGYYKAVGVPDAKGVLNCTSDELQNAVLVAFPQNKIVRKTYSRRELLDTQISVDTLNFVSASSAVCMKKNNSFVELTPAKVANGIQLKATTTDGTKKTTIKKINLIYREPQKTALRIGEQKTLRQELMNNEGTFVFEGTPNTVLTLDVMEAVVKDGAEDVWTPLVGYAKHTLSIKGGKILASDKYAGKYQVVVSGASATVTMKDQSKKSVVTTTYTIENKLYKSLTAPKVKVMNSLKNNTEAAQTLSIEFSGTAYDCKNKYVKTELDAVAAAAVKTANAYRTVGESCKEIINNSLVSIQELQSSYGITLHFEGEALPIGTYKVALSFGTVLDVNNPEATFVPDAKPVTIAIKVAKPKVVKGTFKPVTNNIIDTTNNQNGFVLTASGNAILSYDFTDVFNCNINGVENSFDDYFYLDHDENHRPVIKLIQSDAETLTYLKDAASKKDRTFFVRYEVKYGDDGYGNPYTSSAIVKMTVTVK